MNIKILIILLALSSCASNPSINKSVISKVNKEVNEVPYVTDIDNYGVSNYKATPEEFYQNGGDCEDYAIAKYAKLLDAGIPGGNINYINARTPYFVNHVMLQVNNGFSKYVLDNKSNEIQNYSYLNDNYRDVILFTNADMNNLWNK